MNLFELIKVFAKEKNMKDELTPCKTCSKEIAKSATICPHCGAKIKLNLIEKIILFIIVSWISVYGWLVIGGLYHKR